MIVVLSLSVSFTRMGVVHAETQEKKHTYYLLSDHPMAWENIVIQHSCGNSYCKNRTNWEMIEDVSDGQRMWTDEWGYDLI